MSDVSHFINGQRAEGSSGRWGDVFNPATGERARRVALGGAAEVDRAVKAAAAAFPGWAATPPPSRARVLFKSTMFVLATNTLASGGLRFYHIKPIGIVAHQSAGDFDLALLGFRLLEMGFSPDRIIGDLAASDRYPEYRQIGVLDRTGAAAASTGNKAHPWSGHIVGENYVAMVNSASNSLPRLNTAWPI